VTTRRRILVVDDDGSIRQFLSLALSDRGYEVATAENGESALTAIQASPPDIVLLDMRMPVMDGWAFAAAYRQLPEPRAPVVVLTAARDAARYAAEIHAAAFMPKPFDLRELLRLVAELAA
jgi:CheY-like chemotaxis protein